MAFFRTRHCYIFTGYFRDGAEFCEAARQHSRTCQCQTVTGICGSFLFAIIQVAYDSLCRFLEVLDPGFSCESQIGNCESPIIWHTHQDEHSRSDGGPVVLLFYIFFPALVQCNGVSVSDNRCNLKQTIIAIVICIGTITGADAPKTIAIVAHIKAGYTAVQFD